MTFFFFTAEVERREKSLAEEIEAIESQINANKQNQSIDKSEAMEINEIQIMEDGEENRDPNPEINDKVNDNDSSPIGIKSEFQDTNEDNLKNDHIEVTKAKKIDESNEDEVNKNYG